MKNKIIALITVLCLGMSTLFGCAKKEDSSSQKSDSKDGLNVVCTIFPEYDWMKQILGEETKDVNLTLLMDEGTDLHNFQPTVEDIATVSSCDLFVYVGGESDGWVEDALKEAVNPDMKVINLMEVLKDSVKEEELVEGMQGEEEHDHEEEDQDQDHDQEEGPEYDEHVWLSLKNAQVIVNAMTQELVKLNESKKDVYEANSKAYIDQLAALDANYQETVEQAAHKVLLFGDRFPFRYLVDDYGIEYYAAFIGCSAETEASFDTIAFLAKKVDELALPSIMTIDGSDQAIAKTIIENTTEKNQSIEVLNSMQSVKAVDIEKGANYLSIMKTNLDVIGKVLS